MITFLFFLWIPGCRITSGLSGSHFHFLNEMYRKNSLSLIQRNNFCSPSFPYPEFLYMYLNSLYLYLYTVQYRYPVPTQFYLLFTAQPLTPGTPGTGKKSYFRQLRSLPKSWEDRMTNVHSRVRTRLSTLDFLSFEKVELCSSL